MKSLILVICMGLFLAAHAQYDERDRFVSINPLRNGDGSFVQANNPLFYNNTSTDTTLAKRRVATTVTKGDPFAFRITSLQVFCDLNSLQLKWTTIQSQNDADHFNIEKSSDGGITWASIGTLPANQYEIGKVPYDFVYNKSLSNVDLRVAAVNIAGEKRYSAIVHSVCGNSNMLSVQSLVNGTAAVRIGSAKIQNVRMIVTNETGVVVLAKEAGLTQGINSISLNMSGLSTGVYMLTVIWSDGTQQSAKMIKQ